MIEKIMLCITGVIKTCSFFFFLQLQIYQGILHSMICVCIYDFGEQLQPTVFNIIDKSGGF